MKIEFKNGEIVDCLGVHSNPCFYQGVSRDMYTFLFPEDTDLTYIDSLFSADNCETMIFHTDDGEQYTHEHFTIRYGMGRSTKESAMGENANALKPTHESDTDVDPQKVFLVWVDMVQTTLTERKLMEQQDAIDKLVMTQLSS